MKTRTNVNARNNNSNRNEALVSENGFAVPGPSRMYRIIPALAVLLLAAFLATGQAQEPGGSLPYYTPPVPPTPNPVQIGMLHWYNAIDSSVMETLNNSQGVTSFAFDGRIFVALDGNNNLSVYDRVSSPTGNRALYARLPGAPSSVAFAFGSAWVTIPARGSIIAFRRNMLFANGVYTDYAPTLYETAIGGAPGGIAFDGKNLWVADYNGGNVVKLQVDGNALSVVQTTYSGRGATGVAFDGTNVWVTNNLEHTVSKFAQDGRRVGTYAAGLYPGAIAFDGSFLWIADVGQAVVTKIRPSDGSAILNFTTGVAPAAVVYDGSSIWVANQGSRTVTKLHSPTGQLIKTFPAGCSPSGLTFDGANVWMACPERGIVKIF